MNKNDIKQFKDRLMKEKVVLEEELESLGKPNSRNPEDWSATSGTIETDSADDNEVADKFEELEENETILSQIEPQYHEVRSALERIESGKYGLCEVCNNEIEVERLDANPSARTCKSHMGK